MRERPILFSGPMVRAILDGRKTQTRRAVQGLQWIADTAPGVEPYWRLPDNPRRPTSAGTPMGPHCASLCPYGQPGDRLWVRETWAVNADKYRRICYRADNGTARAGAPEFGRWKPAIHMPRTSCRLMLEVTAVRVERLRAINVADCWAEGIEPGAVPAKRQYQRLWDSLNEKRGFGWKINPWVWVVEFKRIEEARQAA